jgi:hypothetical protein
MASLCPPLDNTRSDLVEELRSYIRDAERTPLSQLCKKGDYTQSGLRYPQEKGEYLADKISTALASQSWIDGESEPVLDQMLAVVGQLDIDANQPEVWQELFDLSQEL